MHAGGRVLIACKAVDRRTVLSLQLDQKVEHALGVRAAIAVVAKEDNWRLCQLFCAQFLHQRAPQGVQLLAATVDVAHADDAALPFSALPFLQSSARQVVGEVLKWVGGLLAHDLADRFRE